MTFLVHALEFLVLVGLLAALAATALFLVGRRMVRRRWRRIRRHVVTRSALTAASVVAAGHERLSTRVGAADVTRGTAARARRHMWVAVEDAEDAVRHADERDAPVAELPRVCASLRSLAHEMDHLLQLERRLPMGASRPDTVRVQVADIINAAHDVQSAALRASSDANEPQLRDLMRQASDEVELVAAAVSRMRSIAPYPR
jgi:hypothetical protein